MSQNDTTVAENTLHCWNLLDDLSREGIPQISDMYLQIGFTFKHVADFGWVPSASSEGSWRKKKKEEEEESR